MAFWRLLRLRDDPPVGVHLVVWHALIAKAHEFPIGTKYEELFVADGLEGCLVEGYGGFVVVCVDAHLGVVDHFCGVNTAVCAAGRGVVQCTFNWRRAFGIRRVGEVGSCSSTQEVD